MSATDERRKAFENLPIELDKARRDETHPLWAVVCAFDNNDRESLLREIQSVTADSHVYLIILKNWLIPLCAKIWIEELAKVVASGRDGELDLLPRWEFGIVNMEAGANLNQVENDAKTSKQNRENVGARHDRPGGSREKQNKIREIWKTGKYTSKDLCAEQECEGLGMSFSTARKALRNQ